MRVKMREGAASFSFFFLFFLFLFLCAFFTYKVPGRGELAAVAARAPDAGEAAAAAGDLVRGEDRRSLCVCFFFFFFFF
jgi:hypothetical protein